jgi:preprotein translocase subunit SecA
MFMKEKGKAVTLAIIDDQWKEHLRSMDELKDSVQAASFEQKDPLVIYKMEAYDLFEQLIHRINSSVTTYLFNGKIVLSDSSEVKKAREQKTDFSKTKASHAAETEQQAAQRKAAESAGQREQQIVETVVREQPKVGRNDPCPCGSGKKYKRCHGR